MAGERLNQCHNDTLFQFLSIAIMRFRNEAHIPAMIRINQGQEQIVQPNNGIVVCWTEELSYTVHA